MQTMFSLGRARPLNARFTIKFKVNDHELDIVNEFCYLGDTVSAGEGCERAIITSVRCAWSQVAQPLLFLTSISLKRRGHLFSSAFVESSFMQLNAGQRMTWTAYA